MRTMPSSYLLNGTMMSLIYIWNIPNGMNHLSLSTAQAIALHLIISP
jgi:hypothetical protein